MFVKFTLPEGAKVGNYFGDVRSIRSDRTPYIFQHDRFGDVATVEESEGRALYVNLSECSFFDIKGRDITFSNRDIAVRFKDAETARRVVAILENAIRAKAELYSVSEPVERITFLVLD